MDILLSFEHSDNQIKNLYNNLEIQMLKIGSGVWGCSDFHLN